ncbi:MAG: cytochrome c, partial [bacterium]|nr:cytochrome c [bacterium]
DQPSFKTQEKMLVPPAGTLPRGGQWYPYPGQPEMAGARLKNPLPRTLEVLQAGQVSFETYCVVCHGVKGDGNGLIVPKFPKPPSLFSEKVRHWPDGRIFHAMTEGQNLMPSYAVQISEKDRWAIVHYVRALQKSAVPSKKDLEAVERLRKKL